MLPRWAKPAVFVLCLLPFALLVYAAGSGGLGPDPAEAIMHVTGEWAIRILLLALLVSPLKKWTGMPSLIRLRRMLGLFAFFYACVHLVSFGHFYVGWTPALVLEELVERPYITVGFGAWLLMVPMALTSTNAMQRRLRQNWRRLQAVVYPVAVLACLHLIWQARSDIGEALVYSAVVFLLLAWRIRHRFLPSVLPGPLNSQQD